MSAKSRGKGQRPAVHGQPLNLSPQVFSKMHQEESLLKEQLAVLKRDMYYNIMDTVHKQQIAGKKLAVLERRIKKDKERIVQIRRTMSAPASSGLGRRQALSFSDSKGRSAGLPPVTGSSSSSASPTYGYDRRCSTVEYFRKLLRPSVLMLRGGDSGDLQWAARQESGRVSANPASTRRESLCFTPSEWVSVNSPSDLDEVPEGATPEDPQIASVVQKPVRSAKQAGRKS